MVEEEEEEEEKEEEEGEEEEVVVFVCWALLMVPMRLGDVLSIDF